MFDERYTICWTAPKQLRIKVWGQYNINNIGNLIQAIAQLVMKFCGIWIVLYLGLSFVRGKPTQGKIKEQETFNIYFDDSIPLSYSFYFKRLVTTNSG